MIAAHYYTAPAIFVTLLYVKKRKLNQKMFIGVTKKLALESVFSWVKSQPGSIQAPPTSVVPPPAKPLSTIFYGLFPFWTLFQGSSCFNFQVLPSIQAHSLSLPTFAVLPQDPCTVQSPVLEEKKREKLIFAVLASPQLQPTPKFPLVETGPFSPG